MSSRSTPATTSLTSSRPGARTSLRPKMSSWRVSAAPRPTGVADVRDLFLQRIVRRERLAQRLGGAEHDAEQVVEVVRHAAGETADGVHLLREQHLRLQLLLLIAHAELVGDVVDHDDAYASAVELEAVGDRLDVDQLTVLAPVAEGADPIGAGSVVRVVEHPLLVFARPNEEDRVGEELLFGVAVVLDRGRG